MRLFPVLELSAYNGNAFRSQFRELEDETGAVLLALVKAFELCHLTVEGKGHKERMGEQGKSRYMFNTDRLSQRLTLFYKGFG